MVSQRTALVRPSGDTIDDQAARLKKRLPLDFGYDVGRWAGIHWLLKLHKASGAKTTAFDCFLATTELLGSS